MPNQHAFLCFWIKFPAMVPIIQYMTHTNIHKCPTDGFLLLRASYGVWPLTEMVGDWFKMAIAIEVAFAHRDGRRFISFSIDRAIMTTMRFFLSTTPLCMGVYNAVSWWWMPRNSLCTLNSLKVNSPPLSAWKTFKHRPNYFSCICLKALKWSKALDFHYRKYAQLYREWSSVMRNICISITFQGLCLHRPF